MDGSNMADGMGARLWDLMYRLEIESQQFGTPMKGASPGIGKITLDDAVARGGRPAPALYRGQS